MNAQSLSTSKWGLKRKAPSMPSCGKGSDRQSAICCGSNSRLNAEDRVPIAYFAFFITSRAFANTLSTVKPKCFKISLYGS